MVRSQLPKELKSALPGRKNSKDRGWKNLGVFKEPKGQPKKPKGVVHDKSDRS